VPSCQIQTPAASACARGALTSTASSVNFMCAPPFPHGRFDEGSRSSVFTPRGTSRSFAASCRDAAASVLHRLPGFANPKWRRASSCDAARARCDWRTSAPETNRLLGVRFGAAVCPGTRRRPAELSAPRAVGLTRRSHSAVKQRVWCRRSSISRGEPLADRTCLSPLVGSMPRTCSIRTKGSPRASGPFSRMMGAHLCA